MELITCPNCRFARLIKVDGYRTMHPDSLAFVCRLHPPVAIILPEPRAQVSHH